MNSLRALATKCQRLSRFPAVLMPLLWVGIAAGPALSSASGARQSRTRSGSHGTHVSRGVGTDSTPATPEIPAAGTDLALRKEGGKIADALAAFSEGLSAEKDADSERALEAYQRSLAFDPGNTELAVKVAFELARRNDVAQGINILKDAAKAAPKDSLPPLCLSQLYGKFLKKQDLAQKYALQALALDSENMAPYLALFEIYTAAGQTKKAEALLDRAAKSSSSDPQFWLQLGALTARLSMKDQENATPEELHKIDPFLEKALTLGKDDPETLVRVADFYVLTKQIKAAIPLYKKALETDKDAAPEELLAVRDKLARCYLADGQREQAISALEALVKEAPTRYETYELLGELYAAGNQLERALASYQQAVLIDSTKPARYLRIADLELKLHKPEDAVKTLTQARAKFPGLFVLTSSLAIALSQTRDHVGALAAFEEALHEGQNSGEPVIDGPFYFAYGVAAEQAGQLDRAAELLRKSIQMDPSNAAQAYNFLGYMWVDKDVNLQEAGDLIKHAVALDPENGAYLDSLGWYYFKTGNYPEALTQLQKAVDRLQPEDAIVFEHLGDIQAALKNFPQAVAAWKKALALAPENKALAGKIEKAAHRLTAGPTPAQSP